MNNTYQLYKSHGICTRCGQENAESGKTMCKCCLATVRECSKIIYHSKSNEERKELMRRRNEKLYACRKEWKRQGLCHCCGGEIPDKRFKTCLRCRQKRNAYMKEWRLKHGAIPEQLRNDPDRCSTCMKKMPLVPGKRLCEKCYKSACHSLDIARKVLECNSKNKWEVSNENLFIKEK